MSIPDNYDLWERHERELDAARNKHQPYDLKQM